LDLRAACAATGVARLFWNCLLRGADHIIVCAEALRESLVKRYPAITNSVAVIGHGVDSQRILESATVAPRLPVQRPYVFSAGTYEAKKGLDVLLRAFDPLASEFPDLSLVIAGRYETQSFDALDALRRSLACSGRIHLLRNLSHAETMQLLG